MINDSYLYSVEYDNIHAFKPRTGSTYIYCYSTENRSHFVDELKKSYSGSVDFIEISESKKDKIIEKKTGEEYYLRNSGSILNFLKKCVGVRIYVDISGMNNRVSASLLKNIFELLKLKDTFDVRVLYAEPDTYKIARFKSEGVFNDLSEQIEGIEPLPGFASIIPEDAENELLVVLLGFEGGRFTHIIENIQPHRDSIIPVIGIPGFRLEYPFVAYWGNRTSIVETNAWRRVKNISANSIVETYLFLTRLLKKNPNKKIKIAPIGTKPHAVGAILFAIKNFEKVELVYDNPIRKIKRTTGVGKIIESKVSNLINEK